MASACPEHEACLAQVTFGRLDRPKQSLVMLEPQVKNKFQTKIHFLLLQCSALRTWPPDSCYVTWLKVVVIRLCSQAGTKVLV